MAKRHESQDPETPTMDEGLQRVREILVGAQHQEFREHFERLEQHFAAEVKTARDDLSAAINALEAFVYNETGRLGERIQREAGDRADGLRVLRDEVTRKADALESAIAAAEERGAQALRAMGQELQERFSTELRTLSQRFTTLVAGVEKSMAELDERKLDRAGLANALTQIAILVERQAHARAEEPAGRSEPRSEPRSEH